MPQEISMKHFNPSICLLISLLFCLVLASCRDKTETAAEVEDSAEAMEDIDFDDIEIIKSKSPLKRLAKAIVDGDAATVADFVSYPLKRPAPIPPIKNKKSLGFQLWKPIHSLSSSSSTKFQVPDG